MKNEALLFSQPDKSGPLWKRGGSFQTWKLRHFVLKGSFLFYFKGTDASAKALCGLIPLQNCTVTKSSFKKFQFAVTLNIVGKKQGTELFAQGGSSASPSVKRTEYVLAAESAELQDIWDAALREAAHPTRALWEEVREAQGGGGSVPQPARDGGNAAPPPPGKGESPLSKLHLYSATALHYAHHLQACDEETAEQHQLLQDLMSRGAAARHAISQHESQKASLSKALQVKSSADVAVMQGLSADLEEAVGLVDYSMALQARVQALLEETDSILNLGGAAGGGNVEVLQRTLGSLAACELAGSQEGQDELMPDHALHRLVELHVNLWARDF